MKSLAILIVIVISVVAARAAKHGDNPQSTPSTPLSAAAPASTKDAPGGEPPQPPAEPAVPTIATTLMFYGQAEQAMSFYVSLFKNSKVISVHRWTAGEPGGEGKIKHAMFSLDGQVFRCMDSGVKHDFTFTPATSLFVNCTSEQQIDALYASLSRDGKSFMPLGNYPFAKKFAWINDRFGVSWQLYLPQH